MADSKATSSPIIELTLLIPALAEANAMKEENEPMPKACFMKVDRCIKLKDKEFVLLKDTGSTSNRFTPPQNFWPTAPTPKHSFNLFARISTIGFSDMENKAAAFALADALRTRRLVCKGVPVREWGLCKTTITHGLINLVYSWDLSKPQSEWDFESQQGGHNFLYFVVGVNEIDSQPVTMFYDLSALQYGVMDTPHEYRMPIPYVFDDKFTCIKNHPNVYAEACRWKDAEQIEQELCSVEEMLATGEFPIPMSKDSEQSRKSIQLLQNLSKFQAALRTVCMVSSEQQRAGQRSK